jgi:hypothetical protein
MKTEVYRWRVSTDLKTRLEREACRRNMFLADVLDLAAREWLAKGEQIRLQNAVFTCFGAFEGGDPHRSENVRQGVSERLRKRYGC